MKIACVDKTAAERSTLQRFVEQAFDSSRAALGHINPGLLLPVSKDEVLYSSAPDVAIVGSGYSIDEALTACRELRQVHENLPLIVLLSADNYSLRALRRFESLTSDIFTTSEPSVRLVHTLLSHNNRKSVSARGPLIVVTGTKGGVGTTSMVSGLAHASEAIGKKSVIIDLSACASLLHYAAAPRWQSSEYTAALTDGLSPDQAFVKKCITSAPNGMNFLLPPAGGSDIRDVWLREPKRFETTLEMVDILREMFDLVLVDTSNTEGVLPYALNAKADVRLLVTSNEPASVHLLNIKLSELVEIPGNSTHWILINRLYEKGLTRDDVIDFIRLNKHFTDTFIKQTISISFDAGGRNWIGTGNSFYTESNSSTQLLFDNHLSRILDPEKAEVLEEGAAATSLKSRIGDLFERISQRKLLTHQSRKALPFDETTSPSLANNKKVTAANRLTLASSNVSSSNSQSQQNLSNKKHDSLHSSSMHSSSMHSSSIHSSSNGIVSNKSEESLYEPPKLVVVNDK